VPGARTRRSLPLAVLAAVAGILLAAPAAHAGFLFPESGGSPNADSIHTLYVMVFVLALVIFVGVEGVLLWSMFNFRARKGRTAAQIHGNTKLEIGWTVGAFVILVFITVFTFAKLASIKDPKASQIDANGKPTIAMVGGEKVLVASTDNLSVKGPSMKITVNGQQYVWRYLYPGSDRLLAYTELVVPVGMTVLLDITADDVAHSWWIPKLGGKFDAIPGYTNKTWFRIPLNNLANPGKDGGTYQGYKAVVYSGQCAELCGRNHANMYARVIGLSFADYKRWYANKVAQVKQARTDAAKQQKALQQQQSAGQ
jgi:cytochrome c oxidase subunit 2